MNLSDRSRRQGHRLVQLGMLLFLCALVVGLLVPTFAVPRLGLSTHLLGIMQGLFLMVIGVLWPRLRPVAAGVLVAEGRLVNDGTLLFAESVLTDESGRELARGSGVFARGRYGVDAGE